MTESARYGPARWTGNWVAERLGVTLADVERPVGAGLHDLVGLAVRRNPRRAHLLVSRVLGKHVPTDPRLVHGAGLLLGLLVRTALAGGARSRERVDPLVGQVADPAAVRRAFAEALQGRHEAAAAFRHMLRAAPSAARPPLRATVVGYAETATALGHSVADALGGAHYLHSTRRPVAGVGAYGGFEEEHSHATSHLLLPVPRDLLDDDLPLVLVDDELSTGATVANTLRDLHATREREHYVVATLVDLRAPADRERLDELAAELGARIDVVALATGRVELPEGVLRAGGELVATVEADKALAPAGRRPPGPGRVVRVDLGWPPGLPDGGRHGFGPRHRHRLERELPAMASAVASALAAAPHGDGRILVLGFEELMYVPLRLAEVIADRTGCEVRYSTTTRSPVLAVDAADYAIRTRLEFPAHDDPADGPGPRFAYNVAPGADSARGFDRIVLVVDRQGDTEALATGLLRRLAELGATVFLVTLPAFHPAGRSLFETLSETLPEPLRGPAFGSYRPEDVAWLLTDLSGVDLEAPTEEREAAIQAGRAHYAESLPQEYQPSAEYQRLFHQALDASADRLARAVAAITEAVLAERGERAVLVSLARAGTPVGVLMRRWAAYAHGLDLPHYAVSIVRGRGIDSLALRYLSAHHDPAQVMFVDGWTGKGAITRELTAALERHAELTGARFPSDLAVLADPGRCVRIFGTREDFLIPSACLNSTVSGLVSRTVLNADLIGPSDFHGAKFYADLAGADVSSLFVDTVCGRFDRVDRAGGRPGALAEGAGPRTPPDWSGWSAVERVGAAYGIDDLNLIKPGVGETTRVLLRRVPWKVLVRPEAGDDLAHVRLLAAERGVPVVEAEPGLAFDTGPYACVGLIKPGAGRVEGTEPPAGPIDASDGERSDGR